MADEDLLGGMDGLGGEDEEEQEEEEEGGSPLMKYLPLVVGVLVVQLVIAYVVANWWLSPTPPKGEMATEEQVSEAPPEGEGALEFQMAPGTTQVAALYEKLEPIVVNPAGTEGLRFLSAQVHLGLSSPSVLEIIDKHNMVPKIRDKLIDIFRTKRIPDLEPLKHDALKQEIKEKLNEFFPGKNPEAAPAIVEIYFQSFVLQ